MKEYNVRLIEMKINNLKNVKNGEIHFINSDVKNTLDLRLGDVLGVYGQNGSGKTTVIDSLEILNYILMSAPLKKELKNILTTGAEHATLFFKFYIEKEDKFLVDYIVTIGKNDENAVEIVSEIIKYSKYVDEKWTRLQTLIEIDYAKSEIKPKKNYIEFFKNEEKINILVALGIAKQNKTSFLFGNQIQGFFKGENDLKSIITILSYFGNFNLFVVSNRDMGMINLNLLLPLKMKRFDSSGNLPVKIDSDENIIVREEIYKDVCNTIEEINIVLKRIIPGMQLKLEKQRKEIVAPEEVNVIATLHSLRDGKLISLRYESEGIKRIVSLLGVLIAVYHQTSVCLAIDELDSGIFEYLLGELLEILASEINGQLIFTSHNLRVLETLNKKNIVFSTVNPENRYVSFKNLKTNHNLRDMYIREIAIQEQNEKLYETTNKYDIKRAFYRAGVINEKR